MNFLKRAVRYCWRQKGRSLILFLVFTLPASTALIALSVGHAAAEGTTEMKEAVGASIRVEIDSNNRENIQNSHRHPNSRPRFPRCKRLHLLLWKLRR